MKIILTFVLIFYFSGFGFFQNYIKSLPVTNTYTNNLDGAVLFTGGYGRLEGGVNYLKSLPNKPLLITGVNPKVTMDILLKENIIPAENITQIELDYVARDTIDNVKMVKKWAKKYNFDTIGLITSAYHVPRSLLLFKKINPQLKIIKFPVKNEKTSQFYLFKEYNKYLYTYIIL